MEMGIQKCTTFLQGLASTELSQYELYADTSRPVSASFVGAPTARFTTYGATTSRDGAVVGLAASTALAEATSLYLSYEGNITGQDSSHALTAGLRMTW